MQFQQWCERVFEFLVEKDLKKERVFLFFWAVERQREKRKEKRNGRRWINELCSNFLRVGLNKRLKLKLLHAVQMQS